MAAGRPVGGYGPVKYVATVDGCEYNVALGESGKVAVNDAEYVVDLHSIDGGFHYSLLVGPASNEVFVERCEDVCSVTIEGRRYQVRVEEEHLRRLAKERKAAAMPQQDERVTSPMPGTVVAVLVREGQVVKTGEGLAILEAMKMENEIRAPRDGVVREVGVEPGESVAQGDLLVHIGLPGS
jgi:biotin carboxyl carrier protein